MQKTLKDFENNLGLKYPVKTDFEFIEDENQTIKWNREQKELKGMQYNEAKVNYHKIA